MYWERNFAVSLDSGYTTWAWRARATKLTQKFGGPEVASPVFFGLQLLTLCIAASVQGLQGLQ